MHGVPVSTCHQMSVLRSRFNIARLSLWRLAQQILKPQLAFPAIRNVAVDLLFVSGFVHIPVKYLCFSDHVQFEGGGTGVYEEYKKYVTAESNSVVASKARKKPKVADRVNS